MKRFARLPPSQVARCGVALLTAEFELLRFAARFCLDGNAAVPPTASEATKFNWHHLVWLGRREGGLLFLHEARRAGALPIELSSAIEAQLRELSAATKLQALERSAAICRLHDALSGAELPFLVVDDWTFQACFHSDRILAETTTAIGCLVRSTDRTCAESVLATAGLPPAVGGCQVGDRSHIPVACFDALADGTGADTLLSPENDHSLPLVLAGRRLQQLGVDMWLQHLAAAQSGLRPMTLLAAWRIARLATLIGSEVADAAPIVAASRVTLGLAASSTASIQPHDTDRTRKDVPTALPAAPFMPTPPSVAVQMLALAGVGPNDTVIDLGCGEGDIVIEAARRHGARAIGIDNDASLLATAAARAAAAGVTDRVEFRHGDLFATDVSTATVICLYLAPGLYEAVRTRVLPLARSGTRIVSHDYMFADWPPVRAALHRFNLAGVAAIYVWEIP